MRSIRFEMCFFFFFLPFTSGSPSAKPSPLKSHSTTHPLPHPRPLPPRRRRRRPFSITSRWRAARKAIKSSLYDWTFLFFWFVFFVSSNNERTQLPRLLFRCGWNSGRVCVRLIRPVAIRKPAPIASSTRLCKWAVSAGIPGWRHRRRLFLCKWAGWRHYANASPSATNLEIPTAKRRRFITEKGQKKTKNDTVVDRRLFFDRTDAPTDEIGVENRETTAPGGHFVRLLFLRCDIVLGRSTGVSTLSGMFQNLRPSALSLWNILERYSFRDIPKRSRVPINEPKQKKNEKKQWNKRKTTRPIESFRSEERRVKFPFLYYYFFFLLYQRRHWRHFRFTASRRRVCVSFLFYFIFLRRSLRRRCGRPPSAPKKNVKIKKKSKKKSEKWTKKTPESRSRTRKFYWKKSCH